MTKKEPKRDSKGRFTSKKNLCQIKKAKDWLRDNKDIIVAWVVAILFIWAITTGLMWAFSVKTTETTKYQNDTHSYFQNENGTLVIKDKTYSYPYTVREKSFYTLPEIIGLQGNIILGAFSGFGQWLWSHPVI